MSKFLSYEKACESNMTFADVAKFYNPEANEIEIANTIKLAEIDCLQKFIDPNPENTVLAIGYIQGDLKEQLAKS